MKAKSAGFVPKFYKSATGPHWRPLIYGLSKEVSSAMYQKISQLLIAQGVSGKKHYAPADKVVHLRWQSG